MEKAAPGSRSGPRIAGGLTCQRRSPGHCCRPNISVRPAAIARRCPCRRLARTARCARRSGTLLGRRPIQHMSSRPLCARSSSGSDGPRRARLRSPLGDSLVFALVASRADPVALVVVPYGRAKAESREATSAALTLGHRWLLVTDGLSLRLVDGLRGESRGFVDFDLDECARDAPSLAWLTTSGRPPGVRARNRQPTFRGGSMAPTPTAAASAARCVKASATRSALLPPPSPKRLGAGRICRRVTPTR